jgi:prophage regulatory protein
MSYFSFLDEAREGNFNVVMRDNRTGKTCLEAALVKSKGNSLCQISNGAVLHAGGADYKGKTSVNVDASIEASGVDGGATVAASDDDDGDGDSDPDSDRRKLLKQSASKFRSIAPSDRLNFNVVRIPNPQIPVVHLPQTGYLRLPAVLHYIPVSKSTWWAGIKSGKYPPGIKLSERVTAWRCEDIHALISQLSSNAP